MTVAGRRKRVYTIVMYMVKFRIPNGGGGMVQGMASAEIRKEILAWEAVHGSEHITTHIKQGWYWAVEFSTARSFILFLSTFKPERDYWLRNMSIEKGSS